MFLRLFSSPPSSRLDCAYRIKELDGQREAPTANTELKSCMPKQNSAQKKVVPVCNFTFDKNLLSHRRRGLGIN